MAFDSRWKNPQGNTPQQLYLWAQDLIATLRKGDFWKSVEDGIANLGDGKAGLTQKTGGHWLVTEAENKTYPVIQKASFAFTITETTTKSRTGTCTVTFRINGVNLGGTANSASTTEQSRTHASDNVVAEGDTLDFVVTSNASCEDLAISVSGTTGLAP